MPQQPYPLNLLAQNQVAGDEPITFAKRIVIALLKDFFSKDQEFCWSAIDEDTRVRISDKNTLNLKSVELRPAIAVDRGPFGWSNLAIDQHQAQGGAASSDRFSDLLNGSLVCMCHSRQGLEAERMAQRVWGFFSYFRRALRRIRFIHEISAPTIGKEFLTRTDSAIDISMVPVTVNIVLNIQWLLTEKGEILQGLEILTSFLNGGLSYEEIGTAEVNGTTEC